MKKLLRNKKGEFISVKPKLLVDNYSKELAEFIGIMLGDGNILSKSGYYYIRISGNRKDEKDYLLNFVNPLAYKLFKLNFDKYENIKNNKLDLTKGSKDLVYTLKKFEFKAGNKKTNNLGIPKWIFSSKRYLKACIRGLVDTDGSICPITGRNYPYIWFKSAIPNLRKTFSEAMDILEIKISKWTKKGTPQIYIGGKEFIQKYYKEIGFHNSKHLIRWTNIINAPVV